MKFAIIGTNYISDLFVDAMSDVKDGEVIAICSRSLQKAQSFSQKYDIPYSYDNYDKMIQDGYIDAAYIATPNITHKDICLYFLERKIPVICEKPLAINEKQVKEIIDCAYKNETCFLDALVPLYTDNYLNLKNNLDLVGKLHRVDLVYSQYSPSWDQYKIDQNVPAYQLANGAGALMALGVYEVAIILDLFSQTDDIVAKANFLQSGVDKQISAIFNYPEIQVTMYAGRGIKTNNLSCIQGEKGTIYFSEVNRLSKVYFEDRISKEIIDLSINDKKEMAYEISEFINIVKNKKMESEYVPHDLSLKIIKTMDLMRKQINLKYPNE